MTTDTYTRAAEDGDMAEYPITFDDLRVGMRAWFHDTHGCGQGGEVVALEPGVAHLVCGPSRFERTIRFAEWATVTEERPLPAEDCAEYHTGECRGPVEWCPAPSGSAIERCEHHNNQRWDEYLARYADSDCEPDWFDPAYAGEYWGEDY